MRGAAATARRSQAFHVHLIIVDRELLSHNRYHILFGVLKSERAKERLGPTLLGHEALAIEVFYNLERGDLLLA